MTLATYAVAPSDTRGRLFAEPACVYRNVFARDKDRIIHTTAFRRLEYKTQVFVNCEGDLFRTRLTHTLEVAQIARSIARNLSLNEDLSEAIALAHDLGHTPFGHAGQSALNECMQAFGGFEHNLQSLRIVDKLEQRYADFDGLNLSFETREGILKHCSLLHAQQLGDVAERFILKQRPSLEAQLTDYADAIAYNNHDIDDGFRSGLLAWSDLMEVPFFADHAHKVKSTYPKLETKRLLSETIRRMINTLITDLCQHSQQLLNQHAPQTISDVRRLPPLICFSAEVAHQHQVLKGFLKQKLYRHKDVQHMNQKAQRIVKELFRSFMDNPSLLPDDYQTTSNNQARRIADYIAGMTDRYAQQKYADLRLQ